VLGWLFGWLAGRVWVVVLFGRPGWPGLSSGWPVVQVSCWGGCPGWLAGRVWVVVLFGVVGLVVWVVVRVSGVVLSGWLVGSVLVGGSRDLVGFGWLCVGPGGRGTGWSFGCRVGGWSGSGLESGGVWGVVHLCFLWFLCWSGWCLGSVFFSWVAVFFGWEHYPSRIEILYRKNKICDKVSQVVFFCCRDCLSFWRYVNGYE